MPKTMIALMKQDPYSDRESITGIFDSVEQAGRWLTALANYYNAVHKFRVYTAVIRPGGYFTLQSKNIQLNERLSDESYYCEEVEYQPTVSF